MSFGLSWLSTLSVVVTSLPFACFLTGYEHWKKKLCEVFRFSWLRYSYAFYLFVTLHSCIISLSWERHAIVFPQRVLSLFSKWINKSIQPTLLPIFSLELYRGESGPAVPLWKALALPLRASTVKAAMMSACLVTARARSTASAPRDAIIWVPLIRAIPCSTSRMVTVIRSSRNTRINTHLCVLLSNRKTSGQ